MSDTSTFAERAYEQLKPLEGTEQGVGEWFSVDQERVDAFADATLDHQFIHVDPERAARETPFGGTIAHGFLTLALLVHLSTTIPKTTPRLDGVVMGINYGLNKVRFLSPVPVGSRVRARSSVATVELKGNSIDVTQAFTVEIEGQEKPALVADWISRTVFA